MEEGPDDFPQRETSQIQQNHASREGNHRRSGVRQDREGEKERGEG